MSKDLPKPANVKMLLHWDVEKERKQNYVHLKKAFGSAETFFTWWDDPKMSTDPALNIFSGNRVT